jgi:hypothetical protein
MEMDVGSDTDTDVLVHKLFNVYLRVSVRFHVHLCVLVRVPVQVHVLV